MGGLSLDLTVITEAHEVKAVTAEVDVAQTGGRYQVTLAYDPVRRVYIISSPNYYISIETTNLQVCADKLSEKGLSRPDSKAVSEVVNQLLLPLLREKLNS